MDELRIRKARIYYYKIYNIADSADLEKVISFSSNFKGIKKMRFERVGSDVIEIQNPPIQLYIDEYHLKIDENDVKVTVKLEINELGTMTVIVQMDVEGDIPTSFFTKVQKEYLSNPNESFKVEEYFKNGINILSPVFKGRYEKFSPTLEHIIYYVENFDRPVKARELLNEYKDLPELLHKSDKKLSVQVKNRTFRHAFSYYADDLVVITNDSSFVYDPEGSDDIIDILDFLNTQLVTIRYYDELLEVRMHEINLNDKPNNSLMEIFKIRKHNNASKKLIALNVEVKSAVEHAKNAIHVTEDVYYARVYMNARQIFGLNLWEESVERKLEVVNDTYNMIQYNLSHAFDNFLEIVVIILIFIELLAFFK
ncbi:RMD1 family protein [Athalassotoga saccharophila]|uniref:hypothetical protein n=1 Tax=Athalassotoga saccharophila TaxID=1441386 RepID=UPI00137969D5|nr:hypothetical protein [Athalassotoga saccharophila]BBJ27665.1 hypothetical protein ATHSA_0550 [Athalassotoga saccharophila]